MPAERIQVTIEKDKTGEGLELKTVKTHVHRNDHFSNPQEAHDKISKRIDNLILPTLLSECTGISLFVGGIYSIVEGISVKDINKVASGIALIETSGIAIYLSLKAMKYFNTLEEEIKGLEQTFPEELKSRIKSRETLNTS